MRKGKKIMRIYVLCVMGTVALLAGAFFLPQVLFAMQDKYLLAETEVKERSALDILQINSLYEKETDVRLYNLSLMNLQDVEITAIDYGGKEGDVVEELKAMVLQEWMERLNYITMYTYSDVFYSGYTEDLYGAEIRECKKYIVYKKDFSEGVALMMWYFDVVFPATNTRMRLLADSETGTIYYVKIQGQSKQVETIYDKYAYAVSGGTADSESFYEIVYRVRDSVDFYLEYYEAENDMLSEYEETQGEDSLWYVKVQMEDQESYATIFLPYEEINMEFIFRVHYDAQGNPEISMGISAIGNIVPEMMQN